MIIRLCDLEADRGDRAGIADLIRGIDLFRPAVVIVCTERKITNPVLMCADLMEILLFLKD